LLVGSKEIGLDVNVDKTKYMVMSRGHNAGKCHNMKTDNSSFERVEEFKYLGRNLTNQNYSQEEIKSSLKSGNACYYLVQKFCLPVCYQKFKIKIYRTIILCVVLYGCEALSLTLKEERRLRVFESRVLRGIFGPKREEVKGEWRKLRSEQLNGLYSSTNIVRVYN